MKIVKLDCCSKERAKKKKRSPAGLRRSAQRIKEYNRKKKLKALFPNDVNIEGKDIDALIEQVQQQNSMLLAENLNKVTAKIFKFQQEFNEWLKRKENELLELQSIIGEKGRVIQSQVTQLKEAELFSI